MKKTITLFVLLLLIAVSEQLSAKTIYLSLTGNDTNNGLSQENAVASLNVAYQLAVDNDNISVSGMIVHMGEVLMDKSITIIGEDENAGFDGQSTQKFFEWNGSGQLNVEQLIFKNGIGTNGGAISCLASVSNTAGLVVFKKCKFIGNVAENHGGALYADGSNVNIIQCVFDGNYINQTTSQNGGAIHFCSSIVASNYLVTQSLFKNNYTTGDAGALYISSDGFNANLNFNNSTCYKNHANRGGAITIVQNSGSVKVSLTNLTITENYITTTSNGNGGGLRVNGGTVNINNCLLYNNWFGATGASSNSRSDFAGSGGATGVYVKSSIIGLIAGNSGSSSQLKRTNFDNITAANNLANMPAPADGCTSIYYTTTSEVADPGLNALNAEGLVTYATDATPVNFSNPDLLVAVSESVDQRDMKRLNDDALIDCGAYEYGATINNNSFPTDIDNEVVENTFIICSNPVVEDFATLKLNNFGVAVVELFSIAGEVVFSVTGEGIIEIPCESLNAGIYLVVVTQHGRSMAQKLVVK